MHVFCFGICLWVICFLANFPMLFILLKGHDGKLIERMVPAVISAVCIDCIIPLILLVLFNWRISRYLSKNDVSKTMSQPVTTASIPTSDEIEYQANTNTSANKIVRNLVFL